MNGLSGRTVRLSAPCGCQRRCIRRLGGLKSCCLRSSAEVNSLITRTNQTQRAAPANNINQPGNQDAIRSKTDRIRVEVNRTRTSTQSGAAQLLIVHRKRGAALESAHYEGNTQLSYGGGFRLINGTSQSVSCQLELDWTGAADSP